MKLVSFTGKRAPFTVIGAVVTMVGFAVTMVVIFSFTGQKLDPGQKMVVITTIIGLIANSIPSLMALQKSESVHQDLHNGVVQEKMKEALIDAADAAIINTPDYQGKDRRRQDKEAEGRED